MRVLVTGAAGFIGSHLCDRLLGDGHQVVGIDSFTDYYGYEVKQSNIAAASDHEQFSLVDGDIMDVELDGLLDGVQAVFHQAGQPGVRLSWADGFEAYTRRNILVTQRLLEASATAQDLERFVFASSSSVYGAAERYPTNERDLPAPMSPYGVTKLAAEHLCSLYQRNFGVPAVSLRYFTVYGPRQRPDMAIHRLIGSALTGSVFEMYGDGSQIRDFTYVGDVVEANLAAAAAAADAAVGQVFNVGGGSAATMHDVVAAVTEAVGRAPTVRFGDQALGDVVRTGADIAAAGERLGWKPQIALREGVALQAAASA